MLSGNPTATATVRPARVAAAYKWIEKQTACILPFLYSHIVFTLPRPFARIAMQNRTTVFNILFRTAAETSWDSSPKCTT